MFLAVAKKNPGILAAAEKAFFEIPDEAVSDVPDYRDAGSDFSGGQEEDRWGHTQVMDDKEWRSLSPGMRNRLQNYDARLETFVAGFEYCRQQFQAIYQRLMTIEANITPGRSARF